ncbi:ribosomal RNA small subunit methyltransferase nep-1 [Ricinus communis]|uniref:ribosomal RNA small subunit methyltransferase nep-1 n=1 Tax=Ricinus communis TaxID=3988 RepID=UPI00201ABD76|nr:ribosomal RNA small subunit methyltransferase nep-1 [Ricinus communis]
MVRPYGIKGPKRKKREEKYDKVGDEVDEQTEENAKRAMLSKTEMPLENCSKKTEQEEEGDEGEELEGEVQEMEGIPIMPSDSKTKKPGVIFVLEKASLEVAKVGKTYQILNSDDHANFLRKNNKNPADYRPDIVYQALLSILDSPLNKAGRLQAVYVKTEKGVLFEVKPYVRIPRTYKRFTGIMLQLLQKLSITAAGKREKLLRVIKNPVTQYLPVNSRKIGFSYSSDKLVKMSNYVAAVDDDVGLVFVVGAMAHGKIDCDYIDDFIAISGYPLSAAWCISRICEALADKWGVL